MPVRNVKASQPRKAASFSKPRKPSLSAERLEQLIAERAGVPVRRVSVFGQPDNWEAALIFNQVGNAERRAAFWSVVQKVRSEFDLELD